MEPTKKQKLLYLIRDNFLDDNLVITYVKSSFKLEFILYDQYTGIKYTVEVSNVTKISASIPYEPYTYFLQWRLSYGENIPFKKGYHFGNKAYIVNKHLLPSRNSELKRCKNYDYGVIEDWHDGKILISHISCKDLQLIPKSCVKLIKEALSKIIMF